MEFDALVIAPEPLSSVALKRMMLSCDHVYLVDPQENLHLIPDKVAMSKGTTVQIEYPAYASLYNGTSYQQKDKELVSEFEYAFSKGALRILNLKDRGFYQKWWFPLRLAYDFDTASRSLLHSTRPFLHWTPVLPEDKEKKAIVRSTVYFSAHGVRERPSVKVPEPPQIFTEQEARDYFLYQQACTVIGKVNRSLLACGEYDLIPMFVNPSFADLFIQKTEIAKKNSEKAVQQEFFQLNRVELHNVQFVLQRISEIAVPDEVLANIPVKELLITRNNCFQELEKLRRRLKSSLAFLQRCEFDIGFADEVKEYVHREVVPVAKKYCSSFERHFIEGLKIGIVSSTAASTAGVSSLQGLDPIQVSLLSGASAGLGGLACNLVDIVKKRRERRLNTFGYFHNFG